jgi:hypothetical protein
VNTSGTKIKSHSSSQEHVLALEICHMHHSETKVEEYIVQVDGISGEWFFAFLVLKMY